jgi:polyisoprenoid-binding protein YceI
VPVSRLIVDDEAARRQAGSEFPVGVPAEDKAATRANMLSAAVLDADAHPRIQVRSVALAGAPPALDVLAAITLRGVTRRIEVPVTVSLDPQQLRVHGAFTLRQTDFGITPFSVALGAITVEDEVQVSFDLVARREGR